MSPRDTETTLTARGIAMRARIVDVAAGLIYSSGVEATSLDDVMAASHTSKSQLYHYFTNKDDLVRSVISLQAQRTFDVHNDHLAAVVTMADLHLWRDAILTMYSGAGGSGGCPLGSLANEISGQSETARVQIVAGFEAWQSQIVRAMRALQANGTLDPTIDASELAAAVLVALQGGLLMSKTTKSVKPLELAFEMAIAHIGRYALT